jgi:hypothetical protein
VTTEIYESGPGGEFDMDRPVPKEPERIVLYPVDQRHVARDYARRIEKQARLEARPYRVDYEINRGHGTKQFTGWYRTEIGARIAAFFLTFGATHNPFTKATMYKKGTQ